MLTNVCVLGLGETGLSMVRWAIDSGQVCTVIDDRAHPPMLDTLKKEFPGVTFMSGKLTEDFLSQFDALYVSPGVSAYDPAIMAVQKKGVHVLGDIELFAQKITALQRQGQPRPKIVAITGSNGKTTVTTLVGEIAKVAGKLTEVAGNISPAVLNAAEATLQQGIYPEVWVLEVSSFQLESTYSLNADAAVVLNISEDHLDRYDDMGSYQAAKERIFIGAETAIVNRDEKLPQLSEGIRVISFGLDEPEEGHFGLRWVDGEEYLSYGQETLMPVKEMQLVGRHNVSNLLGAFALSYAAGLPFDAMAKVGRTFKGLAHRVEFVCEINGVKFYDDSKGTNVGATEAALKGAASPVVLIAGGQGKGQDFTPLKAALSNARAVILIGEDARIIAKALEGISIPIVFCDTLEEATVKAFEVSEPGDMVLLSPACASFDMFKGYAHRAQVFIDTAKALKQSTEGSISKC